jgi:flagellar protein FliO/FliZ
MIKALCATILFVSFHAVATETSPEVLEAERLIASTATPIAAVESPATANELKTPEIPLSAEVTTTAATKESEIPVQLEVAKKASSDHSLFFKAILSLIVVTGMGLGGYVLIGRYRRANLTKNPATQIKVLTQHYLGPKKSLAIIRVAGESVLIGITDHNISMLKSLSLLDEEIPEETPSQFASLFANKSQDIVEASPMVKSQPTISTKIDEEEFSISGIKDFVSTRLKNMRTLE